MGKGVKMGLAADIEDGTIDEKEEEMLEGDENLWLNKFPDPFIN